MTVLYFYLSGQEGLRAYTYDGSSFTNTANIHHGDYWDPYYANDVTLSSEGAPYT